ncbi:MAG: hypothetical protein HY675_17440 [Chloroflexi bacterium]|nr:hypothetical protein [Chloroflexota bacterium]
MRLIRVVAILGSTILMLVVLVLSSALSGAESHCRFASDFQALRDQIPDIVGDCVEDGQYDAATGRWSQATTTGVLVSGGRDYFPAFSDGDRKWVDGPFGLQDRRGGERFGWEIVLQRSADVEYNTLGEVKSPVEEFEHEHPPTPISSLRPLTPSKPMDVQYDAQGTETYYEEQDRDSAGTNLAVLRQTLRATVEYHYDSYGRVVGQQETSTSDDAPELDITETIQRLTTTYDSMGLVVSTYETTYSDEEKTAAFDALWRAMAIDTTPPGSSPDLGSPQTDAAPSRDPESSTESERPTDTATVPGSSDTRIEAATPTPTERDARPTSTTEPTRPTATPDRGATATPESRVTPSPTRPTATPVERQPAPTATPTPGPRQSTPTPTTPRGR